jgi:hypothetical protein
MRSPNLLPILAVSLLTSACAQDKMLHFGAGAATSAVVTHYTGSPLKGCAAALGVGIAKEVWDSRGNGTVETADALATGFGCSVTLRF